MPAYNDANFRAQFPAFANATTYPTPLISLYWTMATEYISPVDSACNMLNGASLQLALDQLCAHLLTLFGVQDPASDTPGAAGGIETSASVGSVSVSELPPPVKGVWDYFLAKTQYGQALLTLLSIKAVGGFYVGGLSERNGFRKFGGTFG